MRCVYGDTTDESHVIRGSKTTDKFKVINKTESQKIITIYLNVHFKPVETLHFKGHIAEEFMWEFDIISSDWHNRESSGKKTGSSRGKEKFNVEYDYSGFIFIENDKINKVFAENETINKDIYIGDNNMEDVIYNDYKINDFPYYIFNKTIKIYGTQTPEYFDDAFDECNN